MINDPYEDCYLDHTHSLECIPEPNDDREVLEHVRTTYARQRFMPDAATEAQVEAACVAYESTNAFGPERATRMRAALVAAADAVPAVQQVSESDALALVEEVIAVHADRIDTHYGDCYKYHVACLAAEVKHRLVGERS